MQKGAAKAEDFKKRAEELSPPERVVLPGSGLPVLLRRPNPLRALLVSNELAGIGPLDEASPEDQRRYIALVHGAISEAMVSPKLSLHPTATEIDPNWLPQEDVAFLLNWSLGVPTSRDAQEFPGQSAGDAASGETGAVLGETAKRDARPGDDAARKPEV